LKGESLGYQKTSYQWVIVGVLWLIHALLFINLSGFGILAPYIKEELHLSSFQIGFLLISLSIGAAFSQMPSGLLVDFTGVRRMMSLARDYLLGGRRKGILFVITLVLLFSSMSSFWPSRQVPSLLPLLPQKCAVDLFDR